MIVPRESQQRFTAFTNLFSVSPTVTTFRETANRSASVFSISLHPHSVFVTLMSGIIHIGDLK